jgi:ABC-type branched-subunit amino acid transport system substrate-binding protein
VVPLTGPIAQKGLSDSLTLAVNQLNAAGGVSGHKVQVTFYDTISDDSSDLGRVLRV